MNFNNTIKALPLIAVALFTSAQVGAAIIDFESLPLPSAGEEFVALESYSEDGFLIKNATVDERYRPDSIASWTSANSNFTGSRGLFNNYLDFGPEDTQALIMTRPDAIPFNMFSVDVAALFSFETTPSSVTFEGRKFGGTVVTQTFNYSGGPSTQRFEFAPTFVGLQSLTWTETSPYHQYDNIAAAPIPEPGSIAMLSIGAGGLLMMWRRRQRRE